MRRLLPSILTVPVLALTGCSAVADPESDGAEARATGGATAATDDTEVTTSEPATDIETATSSSKPPAEDADSTASPDAAGGAEGQAAADRAEEFMVALVGAEPEFCRLLVGFNGDAPMTHSPDELRLCEQNVVPALEGQISEEEAAVIEVIEIDGAAVDGDTARVTALNFGGIFADGFDDADIVLQRFDGQWYVDLQRSDLGSTSR